MPRIINHTPAWLSRPNPGFQLFDEAKSKKSQHKSSTTTQNNGLNGDSDPAPNRTIARRGAEVFVVVGSQIRWADLTLLKDRWEQIQETPSKEPRNASNGRAPASEEDGPEDGSYRILKTTTHEPIHELSISPNGKLMAIITSHTAHLALLPDSSHLGQLPNKSLKLKTSTVGRTTHVISQPPIARALWHPCGVSGNCLVTVTADAVVRLWEFDEGNRWSSDNASLAIDLKKLALGVSSEENFQPERGRNRSFSSDTIGMEVSSACFGGANLDEESPWSSLTLWVAMKAGDVYALCPLLPSKWQPCATMIPALSTAIIAESSVPGDEMDIRSQDSQQRQSQYKWIQELDGQEPVHITSNTEPGSEVEIYARPEHPAIIPRLQGPFQLLADETEDIELSDVHVIAAKSNFDRTSADDDSEEAFEPDEYGLSASVICLLARSGRCYICLDLEGVQGQWLPRRENTGSDEDSMQSTLIVLEGLDTLDPSGDKPMERPTISPDVDSRYSFFMTHSKGVYFFSLEPWLSNLERELQSEDGSGVSFRLDIFRNGPGTLRESILSFNSLSATNGNCTVPACVLLDDSDLGYFLLTTHECQPQAAILDRPYSALIPTLDTADDELSVPDLASLALGPSRTPYQPPAAFYGGSSLPSFIETHVQARHRHLASQQIRLSSATLDVMTETHRLLSHETHQQGLAAADLFRRCERLVEELQDQVSRVAECAERTQRIIEDEGDRYLDDIEGKARRDTGNLVLEERVQHVRDKQVQLHDRFEGLKKKLHGGGGKPLSEKEKSWAKEVLTTAKAVGVDQNDESDEQHDLDDAQAEKDTAKTNGHRDEGGTPEIEGSEETGRRDESTMRQRSQQIQQIKTDLIDRTDDVLADSQPDQRQPEGKNDATDDPPRDADIDSGIPKDLRAKKIDQVMQLLDRESSMIQAASQRLERLILATSTTTA